MSELKKQFEEETGITEKGDYYDSEYESWRYNKLMEACND